MKLKLFIKKFFLVLLMILSPLSSCAKSKQETYTVIVNNGTGGGEYAEGAPVKIKANAPETGKEFTIWTLDGVTVEDNTAAELTFTMPANAVTATANYNFIDYTVTVVGGKTDKPKAHYGEEVTITANAPETGKEFTSWTINGVSVDDKTKAEITFTMPANAVTATANYGDVLYEFALENCTADKESAKFGEQVTFMADVFEDKRFVGWSVKGVDETGLDLTKSPLTITMPANDINVAAQLEQLYKITVSGGCTADKEWAAEGEQVTVNKPANPEGHAFYWWSTGITQDWSNRENTVTFTMPANDVQISASKVLLNYLFTMVGGTATGVKSGEPNTVTDGRSDGFDYGTDVTITANEPETGKRFTGWTITGVDTSELVLTNKELTFKMPANVVTATANYDLINYTVTVNGGTAKVNGVETATAHCGDSITITAEIPTGMSFAGWTLEGITAETGGFSINFTMPANNVTATAKYVYNNYNVTVNGGTANKTTAHYGEEVTITAEVPVGKEFVMWSFEGLAPDGLEITNPQLTFTMPDNAVTATAEFHDLVECDVTVTGGVAQVGDGELETSLKAYCGDTVTLTAYQYLDKTFVKWTIEGIDTEGLDLTQRELTFTMPENDVTATAEFENVPTELTFEGNTATSGELWYVNNDSKSFRLPLGSGQDSCTYTIVLSNSAFTFKVYGSDGEVYINDDGEGVKSITIDREDNYTIEVINTGKAANCTLTVTKI